MMTMMKAIQVSTFGAPDVLEWVDLEKPRPAANEVLVEVARAGVGPWDAWIRAGKSVLPQPLPLTPGSDISGTVVELGADVTEFAVGDRVFGVTNPRFTNGYAQFATVRASMIAKMPAGMRFDDAASMPVIAVTAWQMLHDFAHVSAGQRVLIYGGAGNVGAYAVQLARIAGAFVVATASSKDLQRVKDSGAHEVLDRSASLDAYADSFDVIVDTVGADALQGSYALVKRGGTIVSIVEKPDEKRAAQRESRADFLLVSVATATLETLADLVMKGQLKTHLGDELPLRDARLAHQMIEGSQQHRPGKILLVP
ncbi:NADP-dependent oxidoreductase [Paraburkholderia sp. DHOC27]|uniref:NADP-dependent oxidoreductase n=1 Tax=Paraburkholderia sp. DHOC27 TaxID=2303330 RepID=UPI000E3CC7B8|nr:NADP-dependent oxidoreductase [Paraburkholderia sp. DHOC27]RFU44875.1 NADP-dependent oxidoreductase [Paraburkholderia sp. DHOC27]